MRTLCKKIKEKLCTPLGQWRTDDNKYITSWKLFLSWNLPPLYYREHETWCKYIRLPNQACRCIEFWTYKNSQSWLPYRFQVCRIRLTSSTLTHLRIEATGTNFPPETLGTPLESWKEEGILESNLCTSFKKEEHRNKQLVSHVTFSDIL